MDEIQHKQVDVGGLNLHVAEIGSGPAVLLLHGFPEIWYSWRYQMISLGEAGFRAIAPDFRGYGLSDQPAEPEKAAFYDLVEDVVALLDALGIEKVFVVGKDFGAAIAYYIDLCHPKFPSRAALVAYTVTKLAPIPTGILYMDNSQAMEWFCKPMNAIEIEEGFYHQIRPHYDETLCTWTTTKRWHGFASRRRQ